MIQKANPRSPILDMDGLVGGFTGVLLGCLLYHISSSRVSVLYVTFLDKVFAPSLTALAPLYSCLGKSWYASDSNVIAATVRFGHRAWGSVKGD